MAVGSGVAFPVSIYVPVQVRYSVASAGFGCIVPDLLDRAEATRLRSYGFASRSCFYRFFEAWESSE